MAVRGWSTTERWQRERKLGMNGKSGLITSKPLPCHQWKSRKTCNFTGVVSCVPLQQGLRQQTGIYQFFAGRQISQLQKKRNGGSAEFFRPDGEAGGAKY